MYTGVNALGKLTLNHTKNKFKNQQELLLFKKKSHLWVHFEKFIIIVLITYLYSCLHKFTMLLFIKHTNYLNINGFSSRFK